MQLFWVLKPSQYSLHMVWLRNKKIIFNYARLSLDLFVTQSTVIEQLQVIVSDIYSEQIILSFLP